MRTKQNNTITKEHLNRKIRQLYIKNYTCTRTVSKYFFYFGNQILETKNKLFQAFLKYKNVKSIFIKKKDSISSVEVTIYMHQDKYLAL